MSPQNSVKVPRPPVVVVMGHIDHGKSTLLDYIRKTKVVDEEAGGITQHISAYEIEFENEGKKREIVFLDTPGHEAFKSARQSGAKVADIAILVISAEDGVKPQTIEAIESIQNDKLPFIVALNKIDRPSANIDKAKQELAEAGVLVEGWGGTVPCLAISAKVGTGVEELLETILLQSDVEGISADPSAAASGFVLESRRDPRKGIEATLIIKDGTLKKGMFVTALGALSPTRIMEDFQGRPIESAQPSKPVDVIGWNEVPSAGALFSSHRSKQDAEAAIASTIKAGIIPRISTSNTTESMKLIPIIIKSDSLGSLNALENELSKLRNEKAGFKIISSGIGPVSESDVKTAQSSPEVLLFGFHVKEDSRAKDLALRSGIEIKNFDIIYELIDSLSTILKERTPKEEVDEVTGTARVIRVFSSEKSRQIVGGSVESGEIESGETVKIIRRDSEIGEGKIRELQSQKIKTSSVSEGKEFGMMIDSKVEIVAGDKLQAFRKVTR